MPTRQPTPGPSTSSAHADIPCSHNAKRRAVAENPPEEEPQRKKHRKDLGLMSIDAKAVTTNASAVKDCKKKRRRRKRKSPLTILEFNQQSIPPSHSRSGEPVILSLASSATLSEASVPLPVAVVAQSSTKEMGRHVGLPSANEAEDGKLTFSSIDKGKGRAVLEDPDNYISHPNAILNAGSSQECDTMKAAQAQIAELTTQLESQKKQLSRYEDNLSHLQQSLTCEICLDLLYKPFALSPCGHVACYMCLVRWFTSVQNGNDNTHIDPPTEPDDVPRLLNSQPANRGVFLRNRKTCPLCRASITERPAEIWSIKSMVSNLVKSKLVDLPSAPPPSATETPYANARVTDKNDPWRNIFSKPRARGFHNHQRPQFYPPPPDHNEGGEVRDVEDTGMYDGEDGVYRCLECMHEVWGGECTNCHRVYPGNARLDQLEVDDEDASDEENFLGRRLREIWEGYAQNNPNIGWDMDDDDDDDDDDEDEGHWGGSQGIDGDIWGPDDPHRRDWGPVDLSDESISDEDSHLDAGEYSDSDGNWSSDGGDGDLQDHQREIINALRNAPAWHYGPGFQAREPRGVQELANFDEEDDAESSHSESGSGSDSEHVRSHGSPHSDEEDGYEDSFIDDDEEDGVNGYNTDHRPGQLRNRRYDVVDLIDTDDGDSTNHRTMARQLGRSMRLGGESGGVDDDDGDPLLPFGGGRRGGRRLESPIVVDDEEEEDSDGPAGGGLRRSRRARRVGHVVYDEEED